MKTAAAFLLLLLFHSSTTSGVTIDWVTVGDPGNAPDTEIMSWDRTTGYGSVNHAYQIGMYEVTAGQYTEFLNAVGGIDTHGLYNTYMWSDYGCKIERYAGSGTSGDPFQYQVASDRANRPVNYVSYFDAMRFANWLENGQGSGDTESGVYTIGSGLDEVRAAGATYFLPSEDEWYKAAYHKNDGATGNYWDYPTGSDTIPSNDLVDPDPGNNANFYQNGYTIGNPYYMTEVGELENSESPYGTFDQGGNVREWNEAAIYGSFRGLRGGSFYKVYNDNLHAAYRSGHNPTIELLDVGFCVASKIPEPSTLLLGSLAAMGLLVRRSRL